MTPHWLTHTHSYTHTHRNLESCQLVWGRWSECAPPPPLNGSHIPSGGGVSRPDAEVLHRLGWRQGRHWYSGRPGRRTRGTNPGGPMVIGWKSTSRPKEAKNKEVLVCLQPVHTSFWLLIGRPNASLPALYIQSPMEALKKNLKHYFVQVYSWKKLETPHILFIIIISLMLMFPAFPLFPAPAFCEGISLHFLWMKPRVFTWEAMKPYSPADWLTITSLGLRSSLTVIALLTTGTASERHHHHNIIQDDCWGTSRLVIEKSCS